MMNLRYIRIDHLLHSLNSGLKEVEGIKFAAVDIATNVNPKSSQKTLFCGLCVMHQAKIEDVITELCKMILFAFPEKLPKDSSVKVKQIIDQQDWFKVRQILIEREIKEKFYAPFSQQVAYLMDLLNEKPAPEIQECIDNLQEVAATRNIIVHSAGKVNSQYLELSGIKARVNEIGKDVPVDIDYLNTSCEVAKRFIEWLIVITNDKFKEYTKSKLIRDAWNACFDSPILKFEDWWYIDKNGEIIGFRADNTYWEVASSTEKTKLSVFAKCYTGRTLYPEDMHFYSLDTSNLSRVSELILAIRFIFW